MNPVVNDTISESIELCGTPHPRPGTMNPVVPDPISELIEFCRTLQHDRTTSSRHPRHGTMNPVVPDPISELIEFCRSFQHNRTASSGHPGPGTVNLAVPDSIGESVLEELTKNLDSWERYFSSIIAIAIFGDQITFTVIVSDIYDPQKVSPPLLQIDKEKVRLFTALAFLCFTVTLGAAAVGKVILSNPATKTRILRRLRNRTYRSLEGFTIAACCIDYFPMLASLFLGLAVSAYVPGVGLTVALIFIISLGCKMFWGHIVLPDRGRPWSYKLVAAKSLWEASSYRAFP
jgi:hypothetical protein